MCCCDYLCIRCFTELPGRPCAHHTPLCCGALCMCSSLCACAHLGPTAEVRRVSRCPCTVCAFFLSRYDLPNLNPARRHNSSSGHSKPTRSLYIGVRCWVLYCFCTYASLRCVMCQQAQHCCAMVARNVAGAQSSPEVVRMSSL